VTGPGKILLTRPAADVQPLADRLTALGHKVVTEPLLDIRFLEDVALDLTDVQALAFTSANGVRALVHASPEAPALGLPAFAVGAATELCARDAGFAQTHAAGGDVESLAQTIIENCDAKAGAILHIAGRERAGDLFGLLQAADFTPRRSVLYAADAISELSAATIQQIKDGAITDVVIFSPRTARQFVTLMTKAGLGDAARDMRLLALSARVADAAAELNFGSILVARQPNQEALLDLLGAASDSKEQAMSDTRTEGDTPKNNNDDAAPPIPPALAPENEGQRSGARTLVIVLVVLIALGGAAGVAVTMDPGLRARALAALDALRGTGKDMTASRVEALSTRVARIDAALENLRAGVPGLTARLAEVEKTLGTLATRPPDSAPLERLDARVKALENRLETLAQPLATQAGPPPGALALVAFAGALDAGRPFAPLMAPLRDALQTAGADAALASLDRLMPYAQKGVPTARQISLRVRGVRLKALALESPPSPKDVAGAAGEKDAEKKTAGVWDKIKARLGGLVSIRRFGDAPPSATEPSMPDAMSGAGPDNPLPKIALLIDGGDFAGALAALEKLDQSRLGSEGPALAADLKARQAAMGLAAALVPVIARTLMSKP
jgi:uroporphyrinogen-III synthase